MIRLFVTGLILLIAVPAPATDKSLPKFETHVRSILKQHCFQCHGEESELQGSLDLRLVRLMKSGGDSGAVIIPGDPDVSLVYQRIRDGEMPPDDGKQLSDEEIATIKSWIAAGAETVRPEPKTLDADALITEEERTHWAFQPIRRPEVPKVAQPDQPANPIDTFLLASLEQHGFTFASRATPRTLLRRLTFDLNGLPPTPDEMSEFTQSQDADA